jgi:hypothetical protein
MAFAIGLNGYEHSIDLLQRLRVVELQNPALLADVILIKDTQVEGLLGVRSAPAPSLKSSVPVTGCWSRSMTIKEIGRL